jgi:hypothetical protein
LLPPEPAAWGTALRRAIDDEAWRAGLAAAAREDVAARFSLEHSVCAWSAALERVPLRARATAPAGAWRHVWADLLHGLRLHNRERLAQRARRRDQGR